MKKSLLNARFYETYYFANVVRNILHDQFSFIRNLHDFYGDGRESGFASPFPRYSAFHQFLEFVIDDLICEEMAEVDLDERRAQIERYKGLPAAALGIEPPKLPIEHALAYHSIKFDSFTKWLDENGKDFSKADDDDAAEYLNELRLTGPFDDLLTQSVREAFFVLFGNRSLLLLFNDMMARQIHELKLDEIPDEQRVYFEKDGVLKRTRIPEWVQRAIFYRDRGRCVACQCDLSGLLSVWSEEHFDHMVPLASGGLNDITNLQLLCASCNLKKADRHVQTSDAYEEWYYLDIR